MRRKQKSVIAHIGGAIRKRRKDLGMSLEDLADASDLSFAHLSCVERGKSRISADRLYWVALALKTTVSTFYKGLPQ